MDAVIALWIASLLGAAGFTAVGWFLARVRTPPAPAVTAPAPELEPEAKPEPSPARRKDPRVDEDDAPPADDAERLRAELDEAKQKVAALREELRVEVVARHDAEKRASDLHSRLVSSSQQIAAMRAKLGGSVTPAAPRVSDRPDGGRLASLAPGLFGELEELRREVARLKAENDSLRVAAFTGKRQGA